jgi:hypothetical protein
VAQQVKQLMGSVLVLRHAKRLMSVPLPSGNDENAETCIYHGPDTFDRSSPAISDPIEDPVTEEIDDLFEIISSEEAASNQPGDTERPGAARLSPPRPRSTREPVASSQPASTARSPRSDAPSYPSNAVFGVERPVNFPSDEATERTGMKPASSRPPRTAPSAAPPDAENADSDPTYIGTPFNSMLPRGPTGTLRVVVLAALFALCVIAALELFVL